MMNMSFKRQLPSIEEIMAMYPLTEEMKKQKLARDKEIKDVF